MPPYSFYDVPVVAVLGPVAVVNSEQFTGVVDMSLYHAVDAVLMIGDVANEAVTFRCVACNADGGSPTATLAGKTMTIEAATIANDSTQHVIRLSSGDLLNKASTKRYVKFGLVTGDTSGGIMAVCVRAMPRRYHGVEDSTDTIGYIV